MQQYYSTYEKETGAPVPAVKLNVGCTFGLNAGGVAVKLNPPLAPAGAAG